MILIQLLLIALLIGLFLFLFSSTFRNWVLLKLVERAQRNMQERMGDFGQDRRQRPREEREERPHHHEKIPLDDIEAKRFEKGQDDEYVDFEELP